MDANKINEGRELLERATDKQWEEGDRWVYVLPDPAPDRKPLPLLDVLSGVPESQDNVKLIVWAKNNLPALLDAAAVAQRLQAENRRMDEEVRRLREVLADYHAQRKCGCDHPACKRCTDDQDVERALAAQGE